MFIIIIIIIIIIIMSGSFGDSIIGRRQGKRTPTDYKLCPYPSAILSKV
jgi:hypothetical protein